MNQDVPLKIKLTLKFIEYSGRISPHLGAHIATHFFLKPTRHKRPQWEVENLIHAQEHQSTDGIKYWTWGETGPWIYLVHGWDGRGSQMSAFAKPLVDAGFRVLAFDGPAHGESTGYYTNLKEFSAKVLKFQETHSPTFGVIGHSFGAFASVLAVSKGLDAKYIAYIAGPNKIQGVFNRYGDYLNLTPEVRRRFKHRVESLVGIRAEDLSIETLIPNLGIPGKVFHDPEDQEVPFTEAQDIASSWKLGQLVVIPQSGHRRILRNKKVIEQIVQDLTSLRKKD
ncbi:MAG: alpha/beta hydrolase [Oligoflexia bacterium]|nr:alpha/beta hydrolase [Oligoflexia bacterium]